MKHIEQHFSGSDTVRDVVIGMADGLTVPFALAAGISGALTSTHIVVTAGLAEISAGSIAMGLGGYLAARSDAEHYENEKRREEEEIIEKPLPQGGNRLDDLGLECSRLARFCHLDQLLGDGARAGNHTVMRSPSP